MSGRRRRHGIVSAFAERVAAENPPKAKAKATPRAVGLESLDHVIGAGGGKPATAVSEKTMQRVLIETHASHHRRDDCPTHGDSVSGAPPFGRATTDRAARRGRRAPPARAAPATQGHTPLGAPGAPSGTPHASTAGPGCAPRPNGTSAWPRSPRGTFC